jgi:chemotaxis protein CheC
MSPIVASEEAADALRELGNIAFSHAATALASLLNSRVDVSIPSVHILEKAKLEAELYGRSESLYIVSFRLAGDHTGVIAVLFPQADAWALLEVLSGRPHRGDDLDAEDESTLRELGNIMAGSGLLALYRMIGASLLHSTSAFYRRTALQLAQDEIFRGPLVLVVEAEFTVESRSARGTMIISPNDPGPLLARLGVEPEASP